MIKPKSLIAPLILAFIASAVMTASAHSNGTSHNNRHSERRAANPESKVERIFDKLDSDENGIITLDEFVTITLEKASHQFNRIDTDDDDLISLDEFLAVHHERPDDSEIDVEEPAACIEQSIGTEIAEVPDRETRFNEIDANADGFIDLDEFVAAKTNSATLRFNVIDEDADGGITPEELLAALTLQQEQRDVRRACVEEQQNIAELLTP